jgi:hypothetical protein
MLKTISDTRGWIIEPIPLYFNNRYELGGLYAQLDPIRGGRVSIADIASYVGIFLDESKQYVKAGLQTESSNYEYDFKLIEMPYEILSFKGDSGMASLDLFYGVDGSEIDLRTVEQNNMLNLSVRVVFYDYQWRVVFNTDQSHQQIIPVNADEWDIITITELFRFEVKPDSYHCEIQIRDKTSNKAAIIKGQYKIQNYWLPDLQISDIILSGPVLRTSLESIFERGNISYQPHMFNSYQEKDTVGIYFEIYNLNFDENDMTSFQVSWALQDTSTAGGFLSDDQSEKIETSLDYNGTSRDEQIYLNIDLINREEGTYKLRMAIMDNVSGNIATKDVIFSIE